MKISSMRQRLFILVLVLTILYSCKKESYILLQGKLLVSNSNPVEVSNYKLNFFQAGSPGIPFAAYNSPAEGTTTTDNNGNFSSKFKPGKSGFLIFQGTNSNSINMMGEADGNFPGCFVSNLPPDGGTLYLYKKIDDVSLNIATLASSISPADSIFISYNTPSGRAQKILTGISVPAATPSFLLTNIASVTFGHFDYTQKLYQNDILIKLKKPGSSFTQSINASFGDSIPPGDEPARQLSFFLY